MVFLDNLELIAEVIASLTTAGVVIVSLFKLRRVKYEETFWSGSNRIALRCFCNFSGVAAWVGFMDARIFSGGSG
ncbi:hypothetical protein FACS189485_10250 [Spirochaetia bacterium]|nr:hypothetical protein FACS189485_10250 [Spirochaetia bacterium]